MIHIAKKLASRFIWGNRFRKVQTLLKFARTEAGGAVDIARAAAAVDDPDLHKHLVRHAADEERHAEMFRRRAREVYGDPDGRTPTPDTPGADMVPASAVTERGDLALTDHGFLPSDSFAALGEVGYIAMLYLAECDAAADFQIHRDANLGRDPDTADLFRQILRDEEYHCAYTRAQLAKWRESGREPEVRRALRKMRWCRFKAHWVQLAQKFGDGAGVVMLSVAYLTLFLPFGLIGRAIRKPRGWVASRRDGGERIEQLRQLA